MVTCSETHSSCEDLYSMEPLRRQPWLQVKGESIFFGRMGHGRVHAPAKGPTPNAYGKHNYTQWLVSFFKGKENMKMRGECGGSGRSCTRE